MRYLYNYKIYEDRRAIQHGINQLKAKYIKMGCDIEIAPRYYDSVYLTNLVIPEEFRGTGCC